MAALKVTEVTRGLFGFRITVKAKRDAAATFGSFFGDRAFTLEQGERLTLSVSGREWEEGEELSMSSLVAFARNWSDIPWEWA